MAEGPTEQEVSKRVVERSPITKEEVEKRLHLYHGISDPYGNLLKQIRTTGGILSPKEIETRGLVSHGTNTLPDDREIANDFYVFLSHQKSGYGGVGYFGVYIEIDKSILSKPGTIVNTAGDYITFIDNPDIPDDKLSILQEHYFKSRIPGIEFLDYLVSLANRLPNPNWLFSQRSRNSRKFREFERQAIAELKASHVEGNTYEKFKLHCALDPEILVLDEVPLAYIKGISRAPVPRRNYTVDDY